MAEKTPRLIGEWMAVSIVAALALLATVNGYVYPRSEAATLERRIDSIEGRYGGLISEIRTKLDSLMVEVSLCKKR